MDSRTSGSKTFEWNWIGWMDGWMLKDKKHKYKVK